MRYYVRTGRRSGVSMPLWLALLGFVIVGAALAAAALAVLAIAAAVVIALIALAAAAALVGRMRKRRTLRR